MKDLMQMLRFVQTQTHDIDKQAEMLAAFGPPPEEEITPLQNLPVQNELPAFSIAQANVGGDITGLDYGVAGPVFGQAGEPTLGDILMGDFNG